MVPSFEPIVTVKELDVELVTIHIPAMPCGSKTVWLEAKAPVKLNLMHWDVPPAPDELGALTNVYDGVPLVLTDMLVVLPKT